MHQPSLQVQTEASRTSTHLTQLLSVLHSLLPYLCRPTDVELEKNVATSVETTMIHACNALDRILTEPDRWTLGNTPRTQALVEQMLTEQIALAKHSTLAARLSRTPSALFKPTLKKVGGRWCATYGTGKDAVRGVGETPEQAMVEFDRIFMEGDSD